MTKNQKSSKYPAGPNNISGNKSNGLTKYTIIITAIRKRLAVLKKYLMNPNVISLSEAARSTYGNSVNFR